MKDLLFIFLIIGIVSCANNSNNNYPTSGQIKLSQGKLDTLSLNIKAVVKDSMREGLTGFYDYQEDSIYNLEWIAFVDSMPFGTVQRVQFNYHGKNISSRIIRRKAEAYLKNDLTVLGYKDLIYIDAMSKDSIKNSRRTFEAE